MKHLTLLVLCALLPGCALFRRPPRPVHAAPQEAAAVTFPMEPLDLEGSVSVSGTLSRAMQLAMEDFLPWDVRPHKGATPSEECFYQRDSYDMVVAPGEGGIVFVQIWPRPNACEGPIALDGGAYYAIDAKTWRILAVRH